MSLIRQLIINIPPFTLPASWLLGNIQTLHVKPSKTQTKKRGVKDVDRWGVPPDHESMTKLPAGQIIQIPSVCTCEDVVCSVPSFGAAWIWKQNSYLNEHA